MTDIKKTVNRKFEGEVVSAKGDKTLSVLVRTRKMHEKYKKQYWISKKYAVHDEKERAGLGDIVSFIQCRPISKTKSCNLVDIIKKAV